MGFVKGGRSRFAVGGLRSPPRAPPGVGTGTAPENLRIFRAAPGAGTPFVAFGFEKCAFPPRMSPEMNASERLRPLELSGKGMGRVGLAAQRAGDFRPVVEELARFHG